MIAAMAALSSGVMVRIEYMAMAGSEGAGVEVRSDAG
jgi:hypothetical protein